VGLDWQFAGIGPIHAAGASDLVLRNVNTGQFEVYDIAGNTTAQERIGTVERDLQIAQERTSKVERDLQQARNEVERLTLERDFYSKKASALEQENRELTDSATKYSVHAQKSERPRRLPNTLNEPRSWNEVLPMGSKAGTRTQ